MASHALHALLTSSAPEANTFIKYLLKPLKAGPRSNSTPYGFKQLGSTLRAMLLKSPKLDDYQILRQLAYELEAAGYKRNDYFVSDSRVADRLATLLEVEPKLFVPQAVTSLLDFGCGDATITDGIGKAMHLSKVYGCDVKPDPMVEGVKYWNSDLTLAQRISKELDLITCFVVLHHLPNVQDYIAMISSMLKLQGTLIIREHDVTLPQTTLLLNLYHLWLDILDNPDQIINPVEYYAAIQYRTRTEWESMLRNHGMVLSNTIMTKNNNPQQLYVSSFTKVKLDLRQEIIETLRKLNPSEEMFNAQLLLRHLEVTYNIDNFEPELCRQYIELVSNSSPEEIQEIVPSLEGIHQVMIDWI